MELTVSNKLTMTIIKLLTHFCRDKQQKKDIRLFFEKGCSLAYFDSLQNNFSRMLAAEENNFQKGEKVTSVQGISFYTESLNGGIYEIFGRRDYEFGGLKNCIFVDVGANIGDSALYAALQVHVDYVHAYEPFPVTYGFLQENVALNPVLQKKISVYSYGWSNQERETEVSYCDDNYNSAGNSVCGFFYENQPFSKEKKAVLSLKKASDILSSLMERHKDKEIVLKIDIEGAEYDVLEDLHQNRLLSKVSVIMLEWHYKGYKEITSILEQNGFVWFHEVLDKDFGLIRAYNKRKG